MVYFFFFILSLGTTGRVPITTACLNVIQTASLRKLNGSMEWARRQIRTPRTTLFFPSYALYTESRNLCLFLLLVWSLNAPILIQTKFQNYWKAIRNNNILRRSKVSDLLKWSPPFLTLRLFKSNNMSNIYRNYT